MLETALFKFVSIDDKALWSIALLFWVATLNRPLQALCLALLPLTSGNDLFISLVIHLSDVSPGLSSVFTSDFKSIVIFYFNCKFNLVTYRLVGIVLRLAFLSVLAFVSGKTRPQ